MDKDRVKLEYVGIDLQRLLADPDPTGLRPRRNIQARNDPPAAPTLDDWLFEAARPALESGSAIALDYQIRNTDRTVGARLAGEIARRCGDAGLPPGTITVRLEGGAGQSFGAFCINGLELILYGEANDYVAKGMAGGIITVRPPPNARYATQDNFIIGNTVLYGATGGALFAAGRAGERFAVRNSGAVAVVEGLGDHGCEYMTGGNVVILGETGRNFGAGMTGGVAFVFDPQDRFLTRLNTELVRARRLESECDSHLRELIQRHVQATDSVWAREILDHWQERKEHFWKVRPI